MIQFAERCLCLLHLFWPSQGRKYKFHLVPSGILNEKATCIIGNGVVVHLPSLIGELRGLEEQGISYKGRFLLSDRAHIVFDFHQVSFQKK